MDLPLRIARSVTVVPMSVLAIDTGTTGAAALIVTADGTVAGREG
jgi:hypothetical protein